MDLSPQLFTPDAPPLQASPAYAAALGVLGRDALTLSLRANEQRLGRAQIVLRNFPALGTVAWLPMGPTWSGAPPHLLKVMALRRLAKRLPTTGIRLWISTAATAEDDSAFAEAGHFVLSAAQSRARLDLLRPIERIRADLSGNWRNSLSRADRSHLQIQNDPFPPDSDHWLLREEALLRAERRYRAWPPAMTLAYAQANPQACRLFTAQDAGRRLAGMLFLEHEGGVSYHIGWNSPAGRVVCAHQALLWAAITYYSNRDAHWIDLGVLPKGADGLNRFKLGTGATLVKTGRTWGHTPLTSTVKALWMR